MIPLWLATLWLAFTCTIHHSLAWVFKRPGIAALTGLVAGPLSYYGAASLSALNLGTPLAQTLMALGAFWGLLFFWISLQVRR